MSLPRFAIFLELLSIIFPSYLNVNATGPPHDPSSLLRYSSVFVPLPEPKIRVSLRAAKLLSPPGFL